MALDNSNKKSKQMVKRIAQKKPPSCYSKGDQVLVRGLRRDERVKRGGTKITALPCHDCTIIETDEKNYRYKIAYECGQSMKEKWVSVKNITSTTRLQEIERQSIAKNKSIGQLNILTHVLPSTLKGFDKLLISPTFINI